MTEYSSNFIDIFNEYFNWKYHNWNCVSKDGTMVSHVTKQRDSGVWYCVAGAVAVGAGLGAAVYAALSRRSDHSRGLAESDVWDDRFYAPPPTDPPPGFTLRGMYDEKSNPHGVQVMMEKWKAGSSEPPHAHAGDDTTIVIEGKMSVQFFEADEGGKAGAKDGPRLVLQAGEAGYIKGGRIHDAQYHTDCKLVYVHNEAFTFNDCTAPQKS